MTICLTGGLLALCLILVAAVGTAVLTAGLTLVRCVPSRTSHVRSARRAPVRAQPAARAEAAI